MADEANLLEVLNTALVARSSFFDPEHVTGFRLFNGFLEGFQNLTIDLYGRTIVIQEYSREPVLNEKLLTAILSFYTHLLPWIQSFLFKRRNDPFDKGGKVVRGMTLEDKILENEIWYSLNLQINQDTSFYLDTRNLRTWLTRNLAGKRVLNTFAYTGSLGVAAKKGGATTVIQTDRSKRYLAIAKESYRLNDLPVDEREFISRDFFSVTGNFRKEKTLFDCVILDPPFFSTTGSGRIDLVSHNLRLINKIRPLVAHNGYLITINNALFVSGQAYIEVLAEICADGYLKIDELIDVPEDFAGFPETICSQPPADPKPFNYSTKIAVLRVFRKDSHIG